VPLPTAHSAEIARNPDTFLDVESSSGHAVHNVSDFFPGGWPRGNQPAAGWFSAFIGVAVNSGEDAAPRGLAFDNLRDPGTVSSATPFGIPSMRPGNSEPAALSFARSS
jgi:hypothetical protein